MAAMPTVEIPAGRPLTIADLAAMPDDGHRYELLDGVLIVTPAPSWPHQEAQGELFVRLRQQCPPHLRVLGAPFAVRPTDDKTELQPDILVTRYADLTEKCLPTAPLLAVEVLSPSTTLIDLNLKEAAYERFGSDSYWVVDPKEPSLLVFERAETGEYEQVAWVVGDETFHTTTPFPVSVIPSQLVAGLAPPK